MNARDSRAEEGGRSSAGVAEQNSGPRPLLLFNRLFLCLLLFLAPLKFGLVTGTMGMSVFPASALEWMWMMWPPWLLPPLAGIALLLSLSASRGIVSSKWGSLVSGVWLVLLAGSLPGLLRSTEWDMAQQFIWHLAGAACIALALRRTLQADPAARFWILTALTAGVLCSAVAAWQQVVFGGFQQTLATARAQGIPLDAAVVDRLTQGRACGPFVYPNSLAAHLILLLPVVVVLLWRAGNRFAPVRVSRPLFAGLGIVLLGGALVLSGSRAGIAAFGAAGIVAVFALPGWGRWRGPLLLILLLAGLLGGAVINRGRGLESLRARGVYYRACLQMTAAHPLTGVGLGEFYPWYMQLKPAGAEATRRPHSLPLGFLAQAGLAGGLASLFCLSLPLWFRWGLRRGGWQVDPLLGLAVFTGLFAWFAHALLDFNVQIPGTLVSVAALPFLCADPAGAQAKSPSRRQSRGWWGGLALAVFALFGLWRWPGEKAYARQLRLLESPRSTAREVREAGLRACRLLPLSPYPCWLRGLQARSEGNPDLAIQAFREALERAPHRRVYRQALLDQLRAAGRLRAAEEVEAQGWKP